MQQCRRPTRHSTLNSARTAASDASQYNPSKFGRKYRLDDATSEPLPPWRLPGAEINPNNVLDEASGSSAAQPRASFEQIRRARDFPIPRYKHNPARSTGWVGFLKYTILRLPEPPMPDAPKSSLNVRNNPYRAKKIWPPNLNEMSDQQRFYYEKKFRRRLLNKTYSLRYNWDRWTLFIRRFLIGTLIFYFALVAEPPDPETRVPPDGLRYWMYGQLRKAGDLWPERTRNWIERKYAYYLIKHKKHWDPYNLEGWDESRPVNSLPPGTKPAPAVNQPLSRA